MIVNKEKFESLLNSNILTENYEKNGWEFSFSSSILLSSVDLDKLSDNLKLRHVPEVVFGKNIGKISNKKFNFLLEINPEHSLKLCNFKELDKNYVEDIAKSDINSVNIKPLEIQTKYADLWKEKKLGEINDVKKLEKTCDCFFSTPYKGKFI